MMVSAGDLNDAGTMARAATLACTSLRPYAAIALKSTESRAEVFRFWVHLSPRLTALWCSLVYGYAGTTQLRA